MVKRKNEKEAKEMMKTFTCPKCGGTLQHDELKDILSCPYCGAAVEKESNTIDKILRYKERKANRELEEKKRQEGRAQEGANTLLLIFGVLVVAYIILHYFG